jgi:hypothetical protein
MLSGTASSIGPDYGFQCWFYTYVHHLILPSHPFLSPTTFSEYSIALYQPRYTYTFTRLIFRAVHTEMRFATLLQRMRRIACVWCIRARRIWVSIMIGYIVIIVCYRRMGCWRCEVRKWYYNCTLKESGNTPFISFFSTFIPPNPHFPTAARPQSPAVPVSTAHVTAHSHPRAS